MYDQNPLLHKLSIDDLARDHKEELERMRKNPRTHRFSGLATTLSVVIAAVFVVGANIV